jgi:hypothetical protein
VYPFFAITGELVRHQHALQHNSVERITYNAAAKQRSEISVTPLTQSKVLELCRQNGLYILRLDGENGFTAL